jgi:hypothetical protein
MTKRKPNRLKAGRADERKPRIPTLVINPGVSLKEDTALVLGVPVNGIVPLLDGKGRQIGEGILQSGVSYSRNNKAPKFLNLSEARSQIETDPDRRLLEFDQVFAIDTNTDPEAGRSVTVAARITNLTFGEGTTRTCTIAFLPAIVWCSARPFPERNGWHAAIQMMTTSPEFAGRVAVFVDSDLGKLPAINAHKEPIIGDFILPPNYELLYAAADRGTTEYVGNAAMGRCDRVAARIGKLTASRSDPRGWFHFIVTDKLVNE